MPHGIPPENPLWRLTSDMKVSRQHGGHYVDCQPLSDPTDQLTHGQTVMIYLSKTAFIFIYLILHQILEYIVTYFDGNIFYCVKSFCMGL